MIENHRYQIWINTPELGVKHAANILIKEDGNLLREFLLRYRREYLDNPHSFPLDPRAFPLSEKEFQLPDVRQPPGIVDDYLPDDWGKKVLTAYHARKEKRRFNANKTSDVLAVLGGSRIGALRIVKEGDTAAYTGGVEASKLAQAEHAAFRPPAGHRTARARSSSGISAAGSCSAAERSSRRDRPARSRSADLWSPRTERSWRGPPAGWAAGCAEAAPEAA